MRNSTANPLQIWRHSLFICLLLKATKGPNPMRIASIITAAFVAVAIFVFIFQRDLIFPSGDETPQVTATTEETPPAGPDTRVSVVALRSIARPVDSAVAVRGETEAARQVNLLAETSGTVISTPLRRGASVKAGQMMCQLDPGTRNATLAEAKARLAEAKARVPEAEARVIEAEARLEEALINDRAASKLGKGRVCL